MKTLVVFLSLSALVASAAPPVVSNIRASLRPGTKLVDIYYDLSDADGDLQLVQVAASSDAGLTYTIPCETLSGSVGADVNLGSDRQIVWDAGTDWSGNWVPQCRVRVTAHDGTTPPAPPGMLYVPPGPFQMGDPFHEGALDELPVHNVSIDGFYVDETEVTAREWITVYQWALGNGYSFLAPPEGKAFYWLEVR